MRNYILCFIFLIGCINTQERHGTYTCFVYLNDKYSLTSRSCRIDNINQEEQKISNLYKITFDNVRGGRTYLFGLIEIKHSDHREGKRLNVYLGETLINKFSINDFKEIDDDTIDLNLYLVD